MRITLLWFRVTCLVVPESTCITTQKTENFSERSLKQSSAKNLHVDLKTFRKLAKPPACMSSSVGHRCLIPSSSCRIHLVGLPVREYGSLLFLVLAPDGQSHARKPLLILLSIRRGFRAWLWPSGARTRHRWMAFFGVSETSVKPRHGATRRAPLVPVSHLPTVAVNQQFRRSSKSCATCWYLAVSCNCNGITHS